jgi:hypothetical protein
MRKFDEIYNDLNFILEKGSIKAKEIKKQETIYQPEYARYRLLIYFNNKKNGTWLHSFDNQHYNGEFHIDEYNSLFKLVRKVLTDYKNLFKHAVIYANLDEKPNVKDNNYNTEIFIFNKLGQVKQNKHFQVTTIGKTTKLSCEFLQDYKKITQNNFEFIEI